MDEENIFCSKSGNFDILSKFANSISPTSGKRIITLQEGKKKVQKCSKTTQIRQVDTSREAQSWTQRHTITHARTKRAQSHFQKKRESTTNIGGDSWLCFTGGGGRSGFRAECVRVQCHVSFQTDAKCLSGDFHHQSQDSRGRNSMFSLRLILEVAGGGSENADVAPASFI